MLAPIVPWEMVLSEEEMRYVAALADVIIPADERSPAASAVGVPDYVTRVRLGAHQHGAADPAARRAGMA